MSDDRTTKLLLTNRIINQNQIKNRFTIREI